MTLASLDNLFSLAQASPDLDKTEEGLRHAGHTAVADDLLKVQQDAGVQIDREVNGDQEDAVAPGPETAKLWATYAPVTVDRLNSVLMKAHDLLPENDTGKSVLKSLVITPSPSLAGPNPGLKK